MQQQNKEKKKSQQILYFPQEIISLLKQYPKLQKYHLLEEYAVFTLHYRTPMLALQL